MRAKPAPVRRAIPPMYLGRRGRYDDVAEIDKSSRPVICGISRRETSRCCPGSGTARRHLVRPEVSWSRELRGNPWRHLTIRQRRRPNWRVIGRGGQREELCSPLSRLAAALILLSSAEIADGFGSGFIGWRVACRPHDLARPWEMCPCGCLAGKGEEIHPMNPLSCAASVI